MIAEFTERWAEIEPLLDQMFGVPAAAHADWLRRHCEDPRLRLLVAQALANTPCNDALERGIGLWLPAFADDAAAALPEIAGYRVRRFVGAGGMASVFEAERALPGGPQTVALKLLRIDVHDPDERQRFLQEQRILARLQHRHIAQLLDAGFTPAGTPFLALEFVAGADLVDHAERSGLAARDRLTLFVDVCSAVEHAHRNLVVHRDLKPSNVLVGADGCVKLVDFGIAKLLDADADDTRTGARRLTRTYAAPEQLAGAATTTAIDVHALGMVLAKLLCGRRPRRRDERPAATAARASVAADVGDEAGVRRRLGADLHAIVRKATQFDPSRRYATVAALREDIVRHLDGRPLQARADTFAYRAVTFVKRRALVVATGVGMLAMFAAATVVSLHETELARRAARSERVQARAAVAEAQRADAVKAFLEGLFDSASPGVESRESADELLARGRERADRDFATQPALRVEILALIGDLERRSGRADLAQAPLADASTLAAATFVAGDRRRLHVEYLIAKNADELGRAREAQSQLQAAIGRFDRAGGGDSPEKVQAMTWLAGLDERIGDSADALDVGDAALALARRILPDDSDALTEAATNLGWILMDAGHADRAEPLLREALARKRDRFGPRHADVADAMTLLTSALIRLGRYGESERLMRDALAIDANVYSHAHPHVAWHLNDLANVLASEGRLDEASTIYARSLALDDVLAPAAAAARSAGITRVNLARLRYRQGDLAGAETALRDAIARNERLLGADYADNGRDRDLAGLAEILVAENRFDEARGIVVEALARARQRRRGAQPDIAFALGVEAELMAARGDRASALSRAGEAVAIYATLADARSDRAVRARLLYGEILHGADRDAEARVQLDSALAGAKAAEPAVAALVARAAADLAQADDALGDRADAARFRAEAEAALVAIPADPSIERDAAIGLVADNLACSGSRGDRSSGQRSAAAPIGAPAQDAAFQRCSVSADTMNGAAAWSPHRFGLAWLDGLPADR